MRIPVCRGSLDNVIGVARAKDLLGNLMHCGSIDDTQDLRSPIYVPASTSAINLIDTLRHAPGQLALVNDEYGVLQGVVTPIDVLEAIAGEFPDEDETLEIQSSGEGRWTVAGTADLHQLEQTLETDGLLSDDGSYTSLAGLLLSRLGHMPRTGEALCTGISSFEYSMSMASASRPSLSPGWSSPIWASRILAIHELRLGARHPLASWNSLTAVNLP